MDETRFVKIHKDEILPLLRPLLDDGNAQR